MTAIEPQATSRTGATAGLPSSGRLAPASHCWTSQQWHPHRSVSFLRLNWCPHWRAILTLIAAAVALAGGRAGAQQAAPADPAREAIAVVIDTFAQAFNKHDSAALSVLWSEKATHRSTTTGQVLTGRAAIADAYAALFKRDPKCTVALHVDSLRIDGPSALLTGAATVDHDNFASTRSRFAARLVRVGQAWLIDRVDEAELPPDAETGLQPLAWLVGSWVDDTPANKVVNQFSWDENRNFIVRRFWHEPKKPAAGHAPPPTQGMQIIGWDAEQQVIRTWFFDSHGSFGEGYWQSSGDAKWINKLAVKLPDGRRAAQTQVLEKLGDGQISLQSIDREVDGAAQPNGAIAKFVRLPEGAATTPKVGSAAKEVVR